MRKLIDYPLFAFLFLLPWQTRWIWHYGELLKEEGQPYVIKGITPCSMDLFRYRVYLKNPKVGDQLVFLNAGAYNFSTEFCDLEKMETKVVE